MLCILPRGGAPADRAAGNRDLLRWPDFYPKQAFKALPSAVQEDLLKHEFFSKPVQSDEYLKFIVMKGPVCVDGVSLTVMGKDAESFSVSLVQYTQEHTNLTGRQPGASINLETDIIARYVEQFLEERAQA